jgi:hypothetical protein
MTASNPKIQGVEGTKKQMQDAMIQDAGSLGGRRFILHHGSCILNQVLNPEH